MAAAAQYVATPGGLEVHGAAEIVVGVAAFDGGLQAGEILVEDEVDHAGHRVRAPGRRGAAGHDVHALDDRRRQGGGVHAAAEVGRRHALAVEQDQRAGDAKVAQVEKVDARRAGRAAALRGAERSWR